MALTKQSRDVLVKYAAVIYRKAQVKLAEDGRPNFARGLADFAKNMPRPGIAAANPLIQSRGAAAPKPAAGAGSVFPTAPNMLRSVYRSVFGAPAAGQGKSPLSPFASAPTPGQYMPSTKQLGQMAVAGGASGLTRPSVPAQAQRPAAMPRPATPAVPAGGGNGQVDLASKAAPRPSAALARMLKLPSSPLAGASYQTSTRW